MIAGLVSSGTITSLLLDHATDAGGGILWNPAAWFVGIYRWVAGDERPVFALLAIRGAIAGVGMIALTLVMYPLAYERCLRNVIAAEGRRTTAISRGWASLAARLLRPLLPWPLQRGIAAFMLATLGRSHTHRFIIGLYAGLAFLLSLPLANRLSQLPLTGHSKYGWFAIPLGYVFWSVCGLRVSLMMPVEPVANWIFRLTEPVHKGRVLTTVVTVMTSITALPIASAFAGAALFFGYERLAVNVFLVVSLAGLCLIELLDADDEDGAVLVHVSSRPAQAANLLGAVFLPLAEFRVHARELVSVGARAMAEHGAALRVPADGLGDPSRVAHGEGSEDPRLRLRRAGTGARHDHGNLNHDATDLRCVRCVRCVRRGVPCVMCLRSRVVT